MLARQKVKKRQRAFSREVAEMVRYAVGYRSRAFVTFGEPITVEGYNAESRTSVLELGHRVMEQIGRQMKVLPTALFAAAMRPSIPEAELTDRIAASARSLARRRRQPRRSLRRRGHRVGRRAAREPRHHRARRRPLPRPRSDGAALLRPLDRAPAAGRACRTLMFAAASKALFHGLAALRPLQRLASRYGMAPGRGFARRFIAGETADEAIAAARILAERGFGVSLDYLGESVATLELADAATREYLRIIDAGRGVGDRAQPLAEADAARPGRRSGHRHRQPAAHPRSRRRARILRPHRHGELAVYRGHARGAGNGVEPRLPRRRHGDPVVPDAQPRRRRPVERAGRTGAAGEGRLP